MKRAIVLLGLVTAFAGLSFACSNGASDTLKGSGGGDIANSTGGDGNEANTTPAPAASAPSTQKTTSASSVQSTGDAGAGPLAACDPAKTTTFDDCATCCAAKQPVVADVNSCACGTGSKCASACGQDLCTGGIPSFDCLSCLVQTGCDFGNATTDPSTSADDAQACLQQCQSKP